MILRKSIKINILLTFLLLALFSCSHASISSIPQIVNGEEVYTYTGRANFAHQNKVAEASIRTHCEQLDKGAPIIMDKSSQSLGYNTSLQMENKNQTIYFKCNKKK